MAGFCARVLSRGLWIQPAAVPAGGALGAALTAWHRLEERPPISVNGNGGRDARESSQGPSFTNEEIADFLLNSKEAPHESLVERRRAFQSSGG